MRAYEVSRRDLSRRIQLSAPVETLRTIALAARTEGIVREVYVETGDRVEAGRLLAELDVREQRAELARAEASLREAQANFDRLKRLRDSNYIDEASFITARSTLDIAQSEVELWQTRVDFGRIVSPIDGHVIGRMVEPGASIGSLATAFEIANLDQLVVRIGVSELDVGEILVGARVPIRIDALSEVETMTGEVRRIFPAAEGASRLLTVEISLPDAFVRGVRPGFLARADLLVDYKQDVLAVPAGSVGMGEQQFVMVIDDQSELVRRAVTTGIIRGDWREILGGLEPGDRIVSSNPLDLAEGDLVRVVETVNNEA
ncbi:MAG: efflux RND transporter periplasmic adaptor subunit [Wenzhouxiangellaceae bacterium]